MNGKKIKTLGEELATLQREKRDFVAFRNDDNTSMQITIDSQNSENRQSDTIRLKQHILPIIHKRINELDSEIEQKAMEILKETGGIRI